MRTLVQVTVARKAGVFAPLSRNATETGTAPVRAIRQSTRMAHFPCGTAFAWGLYCSTRF
jgi:hypothetical protein